MMAKEMKSWLDQAHQLRLSQYSPVILVDSNDPRRVVQSQQDAVKAGFDVPKSKANVLTYSEWGGLQKLTLEPDGNTRTEQVSDDKDSPLAALTGGVSDLRQIDAALRNTQATVIMHDIVNPTKELVAAINAWSADGALLNKGSTVLAFLADSVLPDQVRMRCNAVRPPLSTPEERADILDVLIKAAVEMKALPRVLSKEQLQARSEEHTSELQSH